ncbi:MAG: hypothetical protein KAI08_00635 [Bacteroidales bacterium]|nr:hypothetical protein [Bacteroidales bacterium]
MHIKLLPYQALILAILMGFAAAPLSAQTPFDTGLSEEAAQISEQLYVFADRSIYAVDETIYFVADHRVSGLNGEHPWSSVLYVELIASNGKALAQGKYRLSGGRVEGSLYIPAAALTGDYYLKCYTRWMRNMGPGSFSYTPLKIINPYRSEVVALPDIETSPDRFQKLAYKEGVMECSTASASYQSGQEVVLQIKGASTSYLDQLRCCVTVVPEGAIDLAGGQYDVAPHDENEEFRVSILPDLGSNVSISGTVVGPDEEPVPYAILHFSLLGEIPDYFASMSDEHGRFVFSTFAGVGEKKEFFVTPEQEEGSGLEVRIDQEYDSRELSLPVEPFQLSDAEMEVARKIALNIQLSKDFMPENFILDDPIKEEYSEGDRIPFYGTMGESLLIDDYVRLPNLEEVFINLMPEVQFYRKQGRNKIRILSENNSIGVYMPLIMIDHISVFDHEALLALSPEKIQRIDLINDIYLKGNVTFGGVLSIHSRKGDMAGIDLPQGSYFFDYETFYPARPPVDPSPVIKEHVPDTRNTLLWSGNLQLQQDKLLEIPFLAPSSSGSYVILVRGVLPTGEIYAASTSFRVE